MLRLLLLLLHLVMPRVRRRPQVLLLLCPQRMEPDLPVLPTVLAALVLEVAADSGVVLAKVEVLAVVQVLEDRRAWVVVGMIQPVHCHRPFGWREKRSFSNSQTIQSWTCSAFMSCSLASL